MNGEQSKFGLNSFLQGFEFAELRSSSALFAIVLLVNGHDACASESEVVLKGVLQIGNLSLGSDPSQLPTQLSALSETSCSKRVSFTDESSRRVYDNSASVSVISLIDEFSCFTFTAEL